MEHQIIINENFLSKKECNHLLKFSIDNPKLYETQCRETDLFWDKRTIPCFGSHLTIDLQALSWKYLKKVETEIEKVSEYSSVFCDNLNFVKWWSGYEQPPHADGETTDGSNHPFPWRKFGCVYYLNDNYDGGEIWFPNFNIEIKPKPNTMIFFPGDTLHLHGVREVTNGTRHTIASFWGYDETKKLSVYNTRE